MKKNIAAAILTAAVVLSGCGSGGGPDISIKGKAVKSEDLGIKVNGVASPTSKPAENGNPLISNVFCADPTAVEYEGRLYVYGTNDHQQFEAVGKSGSNTYEHIKTLVMLSTDDMANWTYHGLINTEEISPWIAASWAPSVISRTEDDGQTHFYLYYSNSGMGTGVMTSTSPTGPWSDPLGHALISGNTKGLKGCRIPFDPGAVIDDDGTGWLAFGGGTDSARILRLGSDMISIDSKIEKIPSPYHFEASELNFINGTYVYTYNNDWENRLKWDIEGSARPPVCSMAYMTSKTPLDSESWVYQGFYFKNPGEQGLEYGNNHTHLQKYMGKYYLFYHCQFPQKSFGTEGGFRSICVNEALVDEDAVKISNVAGNKKGVSQIKPADPYAVVSAWTMASSSGISYSYENSTVTGIKADEGEAAAWVLFKGADLEDAPSAFAAKVKGKGRIDVFADSIGQEPLCTLQFDNDEYTVVYNDISGGITGTHDLYLVLTPGTELCQWQFVK